MPETIICTLAPSINLSFRSKLMRATSYFFNKTVEDDLSKSGKLSYN